RVVAREQRPRLELVARALGLGLHGGQPAEVAAPQPRQPERRERLEQRALAARGAPRAARDEPDAAVADGQAFEELARVAVRPLVQHEAGLEPDGLALAHDTSKPKRFSSRSLSAQCSRTLTQSSRCTRAPSKSFSSARAAVPTAFNSEPPLPITIGLWLSRSSQINACTIRCPSSAVPRCSTSTARPYGTSSRSASISFSRITSAIRNLRSRSVTMSRGNSIGPGGSRAKISRFSAARFSP